MTFITLDFILKSPGYREGRMKGQRGICFTSRTVRLNGNILRRFILYHNELALQDEILRWTSKEASENPRQSAF